MTEGQGLAQTWRWRIDREAPAALPRGVSSRQKYRWAEMAVGDSFLFPPEIKTTPQAGGRVAYGKQSTGFSFTLRKTPEGVRCWRVS